MLSSSHSGTVSSRQRRSSSDATDGDAKSPKNPTKGSSNFAGSLLDPKGLSNTDTLPSTGTPTPMAVSPVALMPKVLGTSSTVSVMMPESLMLHTNPLEASGQRSILQNKSGSASTDYNTTHERDAGLSPRTSFAVDMSDTLPDGTVRKPVAKRDSRHHTNNIPTCTRLLLAVLCIIGLAFGAGTLAESCLALRTRELIPAASAGTIFEATYSQLLITFFVPIIVFTVLGLMSILVFLGLDGFAPSRIIMSENHHRWLPLLLCIVMLMFAMFGIYTCVVFSYDVVLYRRPPLLALAIVYDIDLFAFFLFFFFTPYSF